MEWSASDQTQMHDHEVSKKRSFDLSQSYPGHLIAVLGHHHEVKCTVRFSNCEPVDEDDDDRKHPARREVPCASPPVNEDNKDENDAVMKNFLMTQDSIDLERPTKAEFAIMWDAMKKMHESSVIEGSVEADNQLVEIIRKKLRNKQLPHASDRPFGNSRGSHNGIGMGKSSVPSTNKHVVKTAEERQTEYPVR
jgi:hypothetical protein